MQSFVTGMPQNTAQVQAAANQVVIDPGGQTFSTIQAAIDSITDASHQKQYLLLVGPGIYNEKITLKEWVFIEGAGQDAHGNNTTTISAPGSSDASSTNPTVRAASNSGVTAVNIESTFTPGAIMCAALDCTGVTNFVCDSVNATAYDSPGTACNILPIVNNFGLNPASCQVTLFECVLTAQAQNSQSFAIALWSVQNGTYQVFSSTLIGTGQYVAVGAAANPASGSNLSFEQCIITGTQYSLQTSSGCTVTADRCTLNGPVDAGVIVTK